MKRCALLIAAAILSLTSRPIAAEQTWSGTIGDSACGAKHQVAAEGQDKMPDRDCTEACVRGGSEYVFVSDGKVYRIANQQHADLAAHAGRAVKLTGEVSGTTITVSKIVTSAQ